MKIAIFPGGLAGLKAGGLKAGGLKAGGLVGRCKI